MPTLSRNFSHEKNEIQTLTLNFRGKIIKKFRLKVGIFSEKNNHKKIRLKVGIFSGILWGKCRLKVGIFISEKMPIGKCRLKMPT